MAKKKKGNKAIPLSPTEKRQTQNVERAESASKHCPACRVGVWTVRKVGMCCFARDKVVCDKCGKLKSELMEAAGEAPE